MIQCFTPRWHVTAIGHDGEVTHDSSTQDISPSSEAEVRDTVNLLRDLPSVNQTINVRRDF